jgi:hypothetical protein
MAEVWKHVTGTVGTLEDNSMDGGIFDFYFFYTF